MSEVSKFADLRKLRDPLARPEPAPAQGPALATEPAKPTGKRSDPSWKQKSILLQIASIEAAEERLRAKYRGTDFSELMQALLDQWLSHPDTAS